jgi:type 1 fimbria pilin
MKKMIRALAVVPVLCTLPLTAMATTAELTVSGTITPATCSPSFSDAGVIDHGNIDPANLSATDFNTLQRKTVELNITCDAPAAFAVIVRDNRSSSVPTGIETALSGPATAMLGLGAVDGKSIGAYKLSFNSGSFTSDTTPIFRNSNAGAWLALTAHEIIVDPTTDQQYSWTRQGGSTPQAYTALSARINVDTALNRANDLPSLSDDVTLDGSATLTMFHL